MKIYYSLCLLVVCLLFATSGFAQTLVRTLEFEGQQRSYRVHIPTNYEEGDSFPLVFNFHGFTSTGFEQEVYSQMSVIADQNDFFVVYPDGIGTAWNVGWSFGSQADDVGFTNAMIDTLHAQYGINLSRVYACGMSNGGFFSYTLACELNDRIAKIASVTGSMLGSELAACMPESPIPILQIHGTADAIVSYNGTPNLSTSIENLLAGWRELNDCSELSDTIMIDNINIFDFSTAELIQHRDCAGDVYMAFYKIDNGGHTWPGALININGNTNRDFSASQEIWDFFDDQYPKDQVVSSAESPLPLEVNITAVPNPATNWFTLSNKSNTSIKSIIVFNQLGQPIDNQADINQRSYDIDASGWAPGCYFIQIGLKDVIKTIRVVKQ